MVSWSIRFDILVPPGGLVDLRLLVANFVHSGIVFLPEVRRDLSMWCKEELMWILLVYWQNRWRAEWGFLDWFLIEWLYGFCRRCFPLSPYCAGVPLDESDGSSSNAHLWEPCALFMTFNIAFSLPFSLMPSPRNLGRTIFLCISQFFCLPKTSMRNWS